MKGTRTTPYLTHMVGGIRVIFSDENGPIPTQLRHNAVSDIQEHVDRDWFYDNPDIRGSESLVFVRHNEKSSLDGELLCRDGSIMRLYYHSGPRGLGLAGKVLYPLVEPAMTDALGDRFWIRMHDECDDIARINFTEIRPNRWSSHMVGGVRVIFNERYTRINAKSKKRILEMTEGALSSRTFPGGLEALVYMVSPRLGRV